MLTKSTLSSLFRSRSRIVLFFGLVSLLSLTVWSARWAQTNASKNNVATPSNVPEDAITDSVTGLGVRQRDENATDRTYALPSILSAVDPAADRSVSLNFDNLSAGV